MRLPPEVFLQAARRRTVDEHPVRVLRVAKAEPMAHLGRFRRLDAGALLAALREDDGRLSPGEGGVSFVVVVVIANTFGSS